MVMQSCAQLLDRPNKQLYGKAKNNQEQLCKAVHNCLVDLTNNCLVKPKTIENNYAKLCTIAWQIQQTIA